jgi:O-acetyl-ADP-ribose deacetylase (regulator of RNase III)
MRTSSARAASCRYYAGRLRNENGQQMIEIVYGNLLDADAEALVNAVNCVGVMGKGIALQFKRAYPDVFLRYQAACRAGQVVIGQMFVVERKGAGNPGYIVHFPTKRDWRNASRLEDIQAGLVDLVTTIQHLNIRSIATPALGCGNGGLDWSVVRPCIETSLSMVPDVHVWLYAPV